MLVFIEKLSLSTIRWVPICQGFNHFSAFCHYVMLTKLATSIGRFNRSSRFQVLEAQLICQSCLVIVKTNPESTVHSRRLLSRWVTVVCYLCSWSRGTDKWNSRFVVCAETATQECALRGGSRATCCFQLIVFCECFKIVSI